MRPLRVQYELELVVLSKLAPLDAQLFLAQSFETHSAERRAFKRALLVQTTLFLLMTRVMLSFVARKYKKKCS